jgi:hypothetical protein
MNNPSIRRHLPFWLSIFAGVALWEIAGRSTSKAFMVPSFFLQGFFWRCS